MSNNYNRNNNKNNAKRNNSNRSNQQSKTPASVANLYFDADARTMTGDFTFNVYGQEKTGRFTFKYPSVAERIRIGTLRAQMMEGAEEKSLDNLTSDLLYIVAFLKVTSVRVPDWFDILDIDDVVGLRRMFTEVQAWVSNFRLTGGRSQYPGDSKTTSNEETLGSDETVSGSN